MANTTSKQQVGLQDIGDGNSINVIQHVRKRDKLRGFFGIPKSKADNHKNKTGNQYLSPVRTPQAIGPDMVVSLARGPPIVASSNGVGKPMQIDKPLPIRPPSKTQDLSFIFLENLAKPATETALPVLLDRIEKTEQLVYCNTLLLQGKKARDTTDNVVQMTPTLTKKELGWLAEMDKNPVKKAHIRWLETRMVEDFIQDDVKDSTEIAEIVTLGPVLDREPYRKLLSCLIDGFEGARILDADMLQGLVLLLQSASPGYLVSDDLVKVFSIFRIRLQETHHQSSEHTFHLTQAVSQVLDVMAEHKVKDLNRVEEHEPLSGVLSGLKSSLDPYLMYQACYAYQALQYVPDDETALQALLRHSMDVADGLVKVSAVFKLDMGAVLEGLGKLQESLGGAIGTTVTVYDGVCSLLESGRGVIESLKEGLGSGQKRPWYCAIRAANAFAQAGQLKDLNQLIYKAPCRRDPLFQWGICQLLGEIASDAKWDMSVRRQAVDLLGELYENDVEWGQDESVKTWMVNIISQLCSVDEKVVNTTSRTLLKELKRDKGTVSSLPYPLRTRFPLPTSSPILARVQNIPYVEYDLHLHKVQRLKQSTQSVYIPPLAKLSLNAKDEDLFPLMEKVQEFLQNKRQVMLVLGDSGAGKSTFNRHLEHRLWNEYKQGDSIPLFINLPAIDRPDQDLITKQLKIYNFKDDQIQELKLHRHLILICDGYDESQQLINLHQSNMLNQPGQWNTKMIVSCRTQFLGPTYLDRFRPQPLDRYSSGLQDLFQEAVIAPFSKDQVRNYTEQYAKDPQASLLFNNNQAPWSAGEYMDKMAAISNVMDLVKNPFLLTLALRTLPGLVASIKDLSTIHVTRAGLYDMFVDQWLETNRLRLQSSALKDAEQEALSALIDDDFIAHGIDYLLRLSAAIFKEQNGIPIVQYTHLQDKNSWKAVFFGTDPEAKLLRDASPLTRTGNEYRFVHRSVPEYLLSRVIYHPSKNDEEYDPQDETVPTVSQLLDANGPLFQRDLLQEPSVINFLCDRVKLNPGFKRQLRAVIDRSKIDESAAVAATNAITILVRAGVSFNGEDLRGVKISNADLSGGQFDFAQFQGADLTGVNLSKSWLRQADMSDTHMEGVRFGELPYLEMDEIVFSCTYSPDGKMFGAALKNGIIYIYDTSTWTRMHRLNGHMKAVSSIDFSPDSQRLVSGSNDNTVRLWDTTSGEELLVMEGHSSNIPSVTISPCGNQIASASGDSTVRLWDAQTGEKLFVLEGHKSHVSSVKYSPDGCQLVSGSFDGTIRFWDPRTGELGFVLSPSSGIVMRLAYSPDGRWVAVGHLGGRLQLWDAVSLEPGPVFNGHTNIVTGIDFSPNGQWIASSSNDQTVRLWDASTGALVTLLTGHRVSVNCVAFSPNNLPIASGGYDERVRLWDAGISWSSPDPHDGGNVMELAYSHDGRSILSYNKAGNFRQWYAATGTSVSIPFEMPEQKAIVSSAYALDGSQLAFGYNNGSIRLWNCQTGTAGPVLEEYASQIDMLVYSPCCRWIVSIDKSRTVRLWSLDDVGLQHLLVDGDENLDVHISAVAFSPTGGQLAMGAGKGIICHFDTRSKECLGRMRFEGCILSLAYSPNCQQLAIATQEGRIYLWDLQSKGPSATLEGHNVWVRCIAYSPCGQWIASACDDMTVGIWHRRLMGEVESWSRVHSICAFFGAVGNVAWNPIVPMELVTSAFDGSGSFQVWRMSTDEGGKIVFKMVWGSNLSTLCVEGTTFKKAVGLSPIHQKLLVQRGALCFSDKPTFQHV